MNKFSWGTWFFVLIFVLTTGTFVSYFAGLLVTQGMFEMRSAFLAGCFLTMLVFWYVSNKGTRLAGIIKIGSGKDNSNVVHLEAEGIMECKDGDFIMLRVSRENEDDRNA